MEALLEGYEGTHANVDTQDEQGRTALGHAARYGSLDCIRWLRPVCAGHSMCKRSWAGCKQERGVGLSLSRNEPAMLSCGQPCRGAAVRHRCFNGHQVQADSDFAARPRSPAGRAGPRLGRSRHSRTQ